MANVNKVVYGGNTLIDLTEDTVTADTLACGYTAHDKSGEIVTGTFTSDATAEAGDIVAGKTAYVNGVRITGTAEATSGGDGIIIPTGELHMSWGDLVEEVKNGNAKKIMSVGDSIDDFWYGTSLVLQNEWIVLGFRQAELEDGTTYDDVPIIGMKYTAWSCPFDAKEQDVATEETALAGTYYVGTNNLSSTTISDYTLLDYSEGDTIDYTAYTYVLHSFLKSVYPAARGLSRWKYSFLRQYLNNSGTGWATEQHLYDTLPSGADTLGGFQNNLSPDMVSALHPIKILTKAPDYCGGTMDTTYDKFWILSVSEMNIYSPYASENDGEPLEYYRQLLGVNENREDGKQPSGTYETLSKNQLDDYTKTCTYWIRSPMGTNMNVWRCSSGYMTSGMAMTTSYRVSVACAII